MKNRSIVIFLLAIVTSVAILFSACRKINESTELGGGLIPPVDNINTFDTSLAVQAFNDTFGLANDTQFLAKDAEFFLGRINNDPFFGRTEARMFFELKPLNFPFGFADRPDSLRIDSVVLVLDHVENYGDPNTGQIIQVYELDQSNNFRSDTLYVIRKNEFTYSNLLGSKGIIPKNLRDSVKAFRDTTVGQLRVRLDNSFGQRLLDYDSAGNGAYKSDSIFKTRFKGFAVQSSGPGNAVMGFDLTGPNTKLAIYYRYLDGGGPTSYDTTVSYFFFSGASAAANYVKRDYTATPLLSSLNNGNAPDPLIYIQGSPGTFAHLKIPDLATLSNRVVHRAELIVEQLYHPSDTLFTPPAYMYLDAFDPSITSSYKYRTIPYDLTYASSGGLNLGALGVIPHNAKDPAGNNIKVWKFNISRYVQHVLTRTLSSYDLRLSAPYTLSEQFGIPPGPDSRVGIQINPTIVMGRVRLHGGTDLLNPQRARLRIIYSKL